MKIPGFVNKPQIFEDSDIEDYPKRPGKLIIPLLIACVALGYATVAFIFWLAVVVLNHFLMAVL